MPRLTKQAKQESARNVLHAAAPKPPTQHHRPVMWGGILGTVYAKNPRGVVRYFDYDVAGAVAFAAITPESDLRLYRNKVRYYGSDNPGYNQRTWYAR